MYRLHLPYGAEAIDARLVRSLYPGAHFSRSEQPSVLDKSAMQRERKNWTNGYSIYYFGACIYNTLHIYIIPSLFRVLICARPPTPAAFNVDLAWRIRSPLHSQNICSIFFAASMPSTLATSSQTHFNLRELTNWLSDSGCMMQTLNTALVKRGPISMLCCRMYLYR